MFTDAPRTTSTSVSCSPSTIAAGSPTTCTATVTDTGSGMKTNPTGTVSFSSSGSGSFSPASCSLVAGIGNSSSCSVTFTPSAAGTHTITASYAGNATHAPSSGQTTITVRRMTSTNVSCSPNPVAVGSPTTCTATVTDTGAGMKTTPTGTVGFTSSGIGTFSSTSCSLVAGMGNSASCSVTYTPTAIGISPHTITATYNGDTTHATSSGTTTVTVAQPAIAISDRSANEGNAGPTPFVFTVTLSTASSQTVTVQYATADNTATAADADYIPATGAVTFLPGQTSQTVTVTVNGDTTFEPNETFFVNLTLPTNATIGDGQGQGTILNDDAQPTIAINDVSANEGNAGPTPFLFTVTLSNASFQTVTVQYATADNTATAADADYVPASGTVTFLPGQTSQSVTVTVNGDTKFETNETFFVNLTVPTNATINAGQGQGTIVNDDPRPTLSINDVAQPEGDVGNNFMFTVTLSQASGVQTTVDYVTVPGSATEGLICSGGTDYPKTSGTLIFLPGTATQTINVPVCGDNIVESAETFFVNLSNAGNATISDSQGEGTIQNDDFAPVITAIAVTPEPSKEGEEVTVRATFTDADDLAGFACTFNFGDGTTVAGVVTPNLGGGFTCTATHPYLDDGPSPGNATPQDAYTITVTVTDPGGNTALASASHVVQNVAPMITLIAAAPNPAAAGTPVTVTTSFTDPGALDAHTCTINWGDGITTSGTVSPPTGSGTCTGTHTYTAGGVLTITVTVTDDDGGSDTDTAFITLVGLGEKVTGGGWIKQPVGAVPNSGGMAYFGFNAKQHAGSTVPTGETNFKYRPGNLHFHSTSYEAMVVTITPDPVTPDKAEWWGSGTINGTGDYCFKVNVTDAGEPGKNDSFRIRIWQKITAATTCSIPAAAPPLLVYDNGFATQSETTLGGGNIQVHKAP
jgi:Calx-beta domain-containing protein/Big-like domain-containing protein/PKD domain-containing protein